ncbi:hypothetical protein FFI94_033350 [Rhodococcus sp. KBS0724]|uniref:hypothetical protein n=1 Tax=Rhodococcus sp. KBS0724 TaxID=1179674 RepID=UPI00110E024A|nr:hypothetical protein [Rhodococcus sp. KBS0724]TSD39689.1 hypothetical protein FFI94_033350 [Rhodococcus sp. KBS0724]
MKLGIYLNSNAITSLDREIAPTEMKSFIARQIIKNADDRAVEAKEHSIIFYNSVINSANNITGRQLYVLEGDGYGSFEPVEIAWHDGEIGAAIRAMSAAEIAEFAAEMVTQRYLDLQATNEVFEVFNFGARIRRSHGTTSVEVLEFTDLDQQIEESAHPNIRMLFERAEHCLEREDYAGVLGATASAMEALAKETVGTDSVSNQSLGGFFEGYKRASKLPDPVADYILEIYNKRNTDANAGHGSLLETTVTRDEAVFLFNITKAFVACENTLRDSA